MSRFIIPFIMAALPCAIPAETPLAPIKEDEKVMLQGSELPLGPKGETIIRADAKHVSNLYFSAWRNGRVSIIFAGEATPNRLCPFISLKNKDYSIKEIEPGIYTVSIAATENERQAVKNLGCVMTSVPSLSRVSSYQR